MTVANLSGRQLARIATCVSLVTLGACQGDDIEQQLDDAASEEVVDDTSITIDRAANTITVGGLPITWEPIGRDPDTGTMIMESDTGVSPRWRIIGQSRVVDPFDEPAYSNVVAVLAQRSLVTDDERRAELITSHYEFTNSPDPGEWGTIAAEEQLSGENPERTCWFHDRTGEYLGGPHHETIIFFTGPDLAAGAWIIAANDTPDGITQIGDITEAICDQRPTGY